MEVFLKFFVGYLIVSGLAKALIIGFLFLFKSQKKAEQHIQALSHLGGLFDVLLIATVISLSFSIKLPDSVSFGDLLGIQSEFIYQTQAIHLLFTLFAFIVMGLLGRFSCYYLHKDEKYLKFFFLFYVFQTATVLLIMSDNFASYFIGWELLGLSSVLLIAFYDWRQSTAKNAIRIFTYYKISDILLFSGFAIAFSHSKSHLQSFSEMASININDYSIYIFLTSLAIIIKMGGAPIIWLPRAMEGPTPSSAIFYGALATHIPLLLFINLWTNTKVLYWVSFSIITTLIVIIFCATLLSRIQSDAKNTLAFATVKHLSIISIEVVLGFFTLAYIHILLHCFYRLFQFIRTPSLLYLHHQIEGYNGSHFQDPGSFFEQIFPLKVRQSIYRFALREFFIVPRLIHLTDLLIGMTSKVSLKKFMLIFFFNFLLFTFLAAVEWMDLHTIHFTLYLLGPPWVLSLVSLLTNLNDWRNLIIVSLSIVSLTTVIYFVDGFIGLNAVIAIQLLLLLATFGFLFLNRKIQSKRIQSAKLKVILFLVTLWLVGVPGPGTYYVFEKAIHLSLEKDMYLSIGAFVILSINTLSVVKNYLIEDIRFVGRKI